MKIISSKFFLLFSVLFGISFLGYLWFEGSLLSEAQVNPPQSVLYNHNGEQMTLTRILAANPTADTGTKACAKLLGSNGQPMVCRNNVESFPYLGDKGCKQFYPGFAEFTSTYPGHGAHGGNYDLICLANSSVGDGGTCSGMAVNTCTTCPQCAKNLDCDESLAAPSNFADGAIVRCFEGPDAPEPTPTPVVEEPIPSAPVAAESLPPVVNSTEIDGIILTEVKGSETGNIACAKFNKVCVGSSTFNRDACLDFYPHAATKNAAVGPQSEHFCKAGSTTGVCVGTTVDTCVMAVSSSQQVSCDSLATNVDSFFVECEEPYAPEVLEQIGGTLPPLSPPVARNDGSGYVDYTVTIHHPQQVPTSVRVEYSTDGGQTYSQATILSAEPSEGTVDVNNRAPHQIGSRDAVDTDMYDSVVLDFVWDAGADEVEQGEFVLRVTVQDNHQNTTTDVSEPGFLSEFHGSAEESEETFSTDGSSEGGTEGSPADGSGETSADGARRTDEVQNCLESSNNGETPCGTDEEILEFLDALINDVIEDGDLSEKERAKAEFIKRYLALQANGQSLEQMLELFNHGMTRGEAVEIIVFLLSSHGVIFENGGLPLEYSDVSRDHPYGQAVAYGTAYGIVEGYPDGSFRPDQAPNMAEVGRMIVRAGALIRNHIQDVYAQEVLNDGSSDWFVPYIRTLESFGLTMPSDYEGLGMTVSGLRFLDILYDLLAAAGVEDPFSQP